MVVPYCGKREAGEDVLMAKIRKIREQLSFAHPRNEIAEHITHRDPRPANTRFPRPHCRVEGDPVPK